MAMAATTSLAQRFFCVATMKRPAAAIAESSSARATAEEAMRPAPNVHEEERLTRLWLAFGFSEVNLCFFPMVFAPKFGLASSFCFCGI